MVGIFTAAALPMLVQWGFSDLCSKEIVGLGAPFFASLPGLAIAYFARFKKGDVSPLGVRK